MFPMLRWSPTASRHALPNLLMALLEHRVTVELHGEAAAYAGAVAYIAGDLLVLNLDDGSQAEVALRAISCITLG